MGPRSIDRGTWRKQRENENALRASMGPRSIDRGTKSQQNPDDGDSGASRGPRSIDRGTGRCGVEPAAETELQWGRDRSIEELCNVEFDPRFTYRFNGAAIDRSRNSK